MEEMIVQEISRLAEDQIDKLICYGTAQDEIYLADLKLSINLEKS
jgi:hypothetical protein